MAKFKYKYETVRKVKETLENKAMRELADIDYQITQKINEVINLQEEKRRLKGMLPMARQVKLHSVKMLAYQEQYLEEQIELIELEIERLREERERKRHELIRISKEHETYKKLREKQLERFMIEEKRREQLQLDEIATRNYVRAKV